MKRSPVEMFPKRTSKRSAIYFCEHRYRADHLDFTIVFDRLPILAVRFSNHHHAAHIESRGSQRSERQKCVIDRSKGSARDQQHGQSQVAHQVRHQLRAINGNKRAACTFHDQSFVRSQSRHLNFSQLDSRPCKPGGQVRRNWRRKFVIFGNRSARWNFGQLHYGISVRALEGAGLDRFPVDRVERGAEQRRYDRFSDTRVGSGDEKSISHEPRRWNEPGAAT